MLNRGLQKLAEIVIKWPKRVLIIWFVLLVVFCSGIFRMDRSVDFLEYFKQNNSVRLAEKRLNEKLGGTSPVYVSVKGDILTPEALKMIQQAESKMKSFPEIIHVQSVATLIAEMNFVMGEGRKIPLDENRINNLYFLLEGQEVLNQLINFEHDEAIINATYGSNDLDDIKGFIASMKLFFENSNSDKLQMDISGMPSLLLQFDKSIMKSQIQSLCIAILLVLLVVSIFERSILKGLISIVPILTTLFILYGFMGIFGIPLDLATVLVGSVSIGIGIDYSIHIIHQIFEERRLDFSLQTAIRNTIKISGRSISINVLAVSAGFLILVLSSLVPLQRFGILVAVTMVGSGLGALTIIPSILLILKKQIS